MPAKIYCYSAMATTMRGTVCSMLGGRNSTSESWTERKLLFTKRPSTHGKKAKEQTKRKGVDKAKNIRQAMTADSISATFAEVRGSKLIISSYFSKVEIRVSSITFYARVSNGLHDHISFKIIECNYYPLGYC